MQIIRIAPPKPSRNRERMKKGKLVASAPITTAQVSRQDSATVRFGPSFTRIHAATKLPRILAAEIALFTDEGTVWTPNSAAMSVVRIDPTSQDALNEQYARNRISSIPTARRGPMVFGGMSSLLSLF